MLLLNYLHAPKGVPLLDVCGLPLSVRAALTGARDGFAHIFLLVHGDDHRRTEGLLATDRRLSGTRIFSTARELLLALKETCLDQDEAVTLVAADRVWQGNLRKAPMMPGDDEHGEHWVTRLPARCILAMQEEAFDDPSLWQQFPQVDAGDSATSEHLTWHRIGSKADIPGAERFLLAQLVKKADGIISRNINRKISLTFTRRLMRTQVTPNQVTAVVLLVGILSGPAIVFFGGYWGLVVGGLLYYSSSVLDGCDGELSRLRFQGSPFGAWLDTVVDDTVGLSYILGLYWYLGSREALWAAVGVVAVSCYFLTLVPRYYMLAVFQGDGDYQKLSAAKPRAENAGAIARTVWLLEDTVCRIDFITFAAPITALLHCPELFAGLFMLGTIGTAADSLVTLYSMRRRSASIRGKRNLQPNPSRSTP